MTPSPEGISNLSSCASLCWASAVVVVVAVGVVVGVVVVIVSFEALSVSRNATRCLRINVILSPSLMMPFFMTSSRNFLSSFDICLKLGLSSEGTVPSTCVSDHLRRPNQAQLGSGCADIMINR